MCFEMNTRALLHLILSAHQYFICALNVLPIHSLLVSLNCNYLVYKEFECCLPYGEPCAAAVPLPITDSSTTVLCGHISLLILEDSRGLGLSFTHFLFLMPGTDYGIQQDLRKHCLRTGDVAQQAKVLATKPAYLISIPGRHMIERVDFPQAILWLPHTMASEYKKMRMCVYVHTPPHTHTHTVIERAVPFLGPRHRAESDPAKLIYYDLGLLCLSPTTANCVLQALLVKSSGIIVYTWSTPYTRSPCQHSGSTHHQWMQGVIFFSTVNC